MCKRPDEHLDAWYSVASHSRIDGDLWEETRRVRAAAVKGNRQVRLNAAVNPADGKCVSSREW